MDLRWDNDTQDGPDDTTVDPDDAIPGSGWQCAQYVAGQTCVDDIALFR